MTTLPQNSTTTPEAATVTIWMPRRRFNCILASIARDMDEEGILRNDDWKTADIDFRLDEGAAAMIGHHRIEVFTDLPGGPIVALHNTDNDAVIATFPKPGPGIYRTVESILAELHGEAV